MRGAPPDKAAQVQLATDALNGRDFESLDVDDERAVIVLRLTGEAKASRLPLDTCVGQVWTWREERVWRLVTYTNPGDAFEAVGLEQ